MRSSQPRLRPTESRHPWCGALLVPPAALAVHQLRYLLAFGASSGVELQRTGHAYLHSVLPWVMLLLAVATGGFLRALGRALGGNASLRRHTFSFTTLWLVCAGCLVAIFAVQEFLEGVFASGHPAGLAGIWGYGGAWAIPASMCVGLVLAACLYGGGWALQRITRHRRRVIIRPQRSAGRSAAPLLLLSAPAPLIAGWSDRGPPR